MGFDWRTRLQERKWELIAGIVGVLYVLAEYNGLFELDPRPVPWPGGAPDLIYSAKPPVGEYRCPPGSPRPSWVAICWAGPESDELDGCETKVIDRQICAVRSCRPLEPPEKRYAVTVGCLMEPLEKK